MEVQVQSLAWHKELKDLVVVAWIRSWAQELPYATAVAIKKKSVFEVKKLVMYF